MGAKKHAKSMQKTSKNHAFFSPKIVQKSFKNDVPEYICCKNLQKNDVFFNRKSWKNITKNVQKSFKNDVSEYLCCKNLQKNYVFSLKKGHISIKNTKNATELSTRNPQIVTVTCLLTNFEHDDKKEQKNNKKSFKNHSKTRSPNIFASKICRKIVV